MIKIIFNSFLAKKYFLKNCDLDIIRSIYTETDGSITLDRLYDVTEWTASLQAKIYRVEVL